MSSPSPTPAQVGRVVRALREARHESQETVADAAQVSRYYYSSIELGERNPTLLVLARIAQALGTTLSSVISRAEMLD
ncbi:MAG TPA: helix-turn-helix transcriptional regulator [Thermoleophilaceae bacterium]